MLPFAQILELYKEYIDPEFSWSNFSIEEQAKVIVAPRSNNLMDTERVRTAGDARLCMCLVLTTALLCTDIVRHDNTALY